MWQTNRIAIAIALTTDGREKSKKKEGLNVAIHDIAPCRKKNCAKLFLLELRQIVINFHNFWQKHGKEANIMHGVLIFYLI